MGQPLPLLKLSPYLRNLFVQRIQGTSFVRVRMRVLSAALVPLVSSALVMLSNALRHKLHGNLPVPLM